MGEVIAASRLSVRRAPGADRLRTACWTVACAVALVHTWPHRDGLVNFDAVSYLDIARDYARGDWNSALNGYWSPMYSWLLALALAIVRPSPGFEYPLLHIVNGGLFALALAALDWLVAELRRRADADAEGVSGLSSFGWQLAASSLFLWVAIELIVVWLEDPDLLVLGSVCVIARVLLRIEAGLGTRRTWAGLGAALGAGYLAKTAMLPLAPVFLAVAVWVAPRRQRVIGAAIAVVCLAAVGGPFIIALSVREGRPAFGHSGTLNYVWFVNHSADWPRQWPAHWPHWDGDPRSGRAAHPARLLMRDPAVYEFGSPIGGTYAMWRDPAYWHEGVHAAASARDQLRRLRLSATDLYALFTLNPYNAEFFNPQPAILAVIIMLLAVAGWRRSAAAVALIVPAAAAVAMYAAVYIEPRYLGGFMLVGWIGVLLVPAAARNGFASRRLRDAAAVAIAVVCVGSVAAATVFEVWPEVQRRAGRRAPLPTPADVAASFGAAGLRRGDPIAVIGNAQVASRWAHLAGVRIVAEVPAADAPIFWADPARGRKALDAVAPYVAAVVADWPPGFTSAPAGWRTVDGAAYFVRIERP